jgi:hypothetical protein
MSDPFFNRPIPEGVGKTEFYQHDQNWFNRMILVDSLQVMASLAEREGLRGQVRCIYLDPPYGIKFNSNFQWSTTRPSRPSPTTRRSTSLYLPKNACTRSSLRVRGIGGRLSRNTRP